MLSQGVGKIINTASMASLLVPHPQKQAAYNASKAAGKSKPEGHQCYWHCPVIMVRTATTRGLAAAYIYERKLRH
jgi:hypothetical protein